MDHTSLADWFFLGVSWSIVGVLCFGGLSLLRTFLAARSITAAGVIVTGVGLFMVAAMVFA